MLRRTLVCAAFATWCFLNTWVELAEGYGPYYARYAPMRAVVAPVVCWEILLTLALLGTWKLVDGLGAKAKTLAHFAFLLCCALPLGIASVALLRAMPVDATPLVRNRLFWPIAALATIAPCLFMVRRPATASKWIRGLFLYSWPLLVLILLQAWRGTLRFPASAYADGPMAASTGSPAPRVRAVWIIFDELSREIAFDRRPASLDLPRLDRFRAESFDGAAAHSPSNATETSLPSLLTGRRVTAVAHPVPNRLILTVEGSPSPVEWSDTPNVFDAVRRRGFDSALVGWFHPYGRLLNRSLTQCYWTAGWLLAGIEEPSEPRSLIQGLADRAELQFEVLPLIGHVPGVNPGRAQRRAKHERYSYLLDRAVAIATDPRIALAVIHLPVPHPPAFYSRAERRFTTEGRLDYLDSVALADRTLGVLRDAMEAAGQWDRTAVLVSSDHGWRTNLWRGGPDWTPEEETESRGETLGVPFLLKLPGQRTGIRYGEPFNTIVSGELLTDILDGRLADPARIAGEIAGRPASRLPRHD